MEGSDSILYTRTHWVENEERDSYLTISLGNTKVITLHRPDLLHYCRKIVEKDSGPELIVDERCTLDLNDLPCEHLNPFIIAGILSQYFTPYFYLKKEEMNNNTYLINEMIKLIRFLQPSGIYAYFSWFIDNTLDFITQEEVDKILKRRLAEYPENIEYLEKKYIFDKYQTDEDFEIIKNYLDVIADKKNFDNEELNYFKKIKGTKILDYLRKKILEKKRPEPLYQLLTNGYKTNLSKEINPEELLILYRYIKLDKVYPEVKEEDINVFINYIMFGLIHEITPMKFIFEEMIIFPGENDMSFVIYYNKDNPHIAIENIEFYYHRKNSNLIMVKDFMYRKMDSAHKLKPYCDIPVKPDEFLGNLYDFHPWKFYQDLTKDRFNEKLKEYEKIICPIVGKIFKGKITIIPLA